jgi:uncharacterized membrane protein
VKIHWKEVLPIMAEKIEQPIKWTAGRIWKLVGIIADVAITVFLLILSIIIASNISNKDELASATGFMGMVYYFMDNPNVFLFSVVVPLFVLLVVNIVLTVYYYQKIAEKEKEEAKKAPTLDKLSEEQKSALRQQLLQEMQNKAVEEVKPVVVEEVKPVEVKAPAKKAPAKKSTTVKTTTVKKTSTAKKPVAKKTTAPKAPAKKTVEKK